MSISIRLLSRVVLALAFVGASLVFQPGRPVAANFVSKNSRTWTACILYTRPCMTNDSTLVVAIGPMGPISQQGFLLAMSSYDSTHLNVVGGSGDNGLTDLYYHYEPLLPGNLARYSCQAVSSGWRCGHAHVLIDDSQTVGYTLNQMRGLFCHESGHGVGLTHGLDGDPELDNDHSDLACMRRPLSPAAGLAAVHNVPHINYHY